MRKILRLSLALVMALVAQVSFAQISTVTFTAGTDKGSQTSVTTSDEVTKDGITITSDKGAFGAAQYRFGQGSTSTITASTGNIVKIVFTCTANGTTKYGPGCITATPGTYTYEASGKTGTWTGEATSVVLSAASAQMRATTIEVTVSGASSDYVAAPTISGDATFKESTTVTISAAEGTTIKYTVNGDDPTDDRGEVLDYTAPFTINATTTVQAVAYKGEVASEIASKTFTLLTTTGEGTLASPYTVADVITLQNANAAPSDSVYVSGVVSQAATSVSSYGDVSFYLSDDGTTANQIEAFNNYYFHKAKYSAISQAPVKGDKVVLFGAITKYNSTIELARGNYLVSVNGKTEGEEVKVDTLSFTVAEALAALAANTQPTGVCYITGTLTEDADTTGVGSYGSITYNISDDGTTASVLKVYRGKSFSGKWFTKDFYLKKGDKVKILGQLVNYTKDETTTPEVTTGSQLISVNNQTAGVSTLKVDSTDAPLYNLAGQRVANNYRGMVIQNGKKFFKK